MYAYTEFDRQFVRARAAQFRDQLDRHFAGHLPDDDFKALRLQNGWYVQRYAPMLRVAVPYGELSSKQLRVTTISLMRRCLMARRLHKTSWEIFRCPTGIPSKQISPKATATSLPARTCSTTGFRWTNQPM